MKFNYRKAGPHLVSQPEMFSPLKLGGDWRTSEWVATLYTDKSGILRNVWTNKKRHSAWKWPGCVEGVVMLQLIILTINIVNAGRRILSCNKPHSNTLFSSVTVTLIFCLISSQTSPSNMLFNLKKIFTTGGRAWIVKVNWEFLFSQRLWQCWWYQPYLQILWNAGRLFYREIKYKSRRGLKSILQSDKLQERLGITFPMDHTSVRKRKSKTWTSETDWDTLQ